MARTWSRDTDEGDTVTVTVDPRGVAVSVLRISGAREGFTTSLEDFESDVAPWLSAPFVDAIDEIRDAVDHARSAADDEDDAIP